MKGVARTMVDIGLACLATGVLSPCPSQQPRPHKGDDLEPVAGAFGRSVDLEDYDRKIAALLLRKAPYDSVLAFVVLPSFDPEAVLAINAKGTGYEGLTLRPDQNLWYDKRPAGEVKVAKHEKQVPVEVAKRAIALWGAMLARVHYQDHEGQDLDGVAFVFRSWQQGRGTRVGESSNPYEGTRGWWLAKVGELLVKFVEAPAADEAAVLKDLGKAMETLEGMLKDLDAKAEKTGK